MLTLNGMALRGAPASTTPAQSAIPATVMVATGEMKAKDFTVRAETDPSKEK